MTRTINYFVYIDTALTIIMNSSIFDMMPYYAISLTIFNFYKYCLHILFKVYCLKHIKNYISEMFQIFCSIKNSFWIGRM